MSNIKEERKQELMGYQLPTYKEIPSVGLYLDQTSKYLNEVLNQLPGCSITNSMISNYVKHHIISNPVKKQYSRDQIACLIFITIAKKVLPLEDVAKVIRTGTDEHSFRQAYEYFSTVFAEYLHRIFADEQITDYTDESSEKSLVKRIIVTAVNQLYLEEFFSNDDQ